jgi:hypothetical protein
MQTWVVILSLIVILVHALQVDPKCRLVSNLSFCSMVNYNISALYVPDVNKLDEEARNQYEKYKDGMKIQTSECMAAFKAYTCAFRFPRCPYCMDEDVFCRTGCVQYYAACGSGPGDTELTCFRGDIYANDSQICTPQIPQGVNYSCVRPTNLQFCNETFLNYTVYSVTNRQSANQVWQVMDLVTQRRYKSFASPNFTRSCLNTLQAVLCMIDFTPCDNQGRFQDPTVPLKPLCARLVQTCGDHVASKLCSFNVPTPPDPSKCVPPRGYKLK